MFVVEFWSISPDENHISIYCMGSNNPSFPKWIETLKSGYKHKLYGIKKIDYVELMTEGQNYGMDDEQYKEIRKLIRTGYSFWASDSYDVKIRGGADGSE